MSALFRLLLFTKANQVVPEREKRICVYLPLVPRIFTLLPLLTDPHELPPGRRQAFSVLCTLRVLPDVLHRIAFVETYPVFFLLPLPA